MYNLYLLNKIYLKKNIINNNYNFKICNKFYHKLFFKFCIKLLINYKIIQLAKIIIFIFLNRYEKLVFLEDCNKIISFCFLQKKQNKYSFMEKNDIMLGNIFCHEKFRKKKIAYEMCHFILSNHINSYSNFFFLCDKKNLASNKLALKCFFFLFKRLDKDYSFLNKNY